MQDNSDPAPPVTECRRVNGSPPALEAGALKGLAGSSPATPTKSFKRLSAMDRYHRDPVFRSLVDALYSHIAAANFTPTELREACHLAAVQYESIYIRPMYIARDHVGIF